VLCYLLCSPRVLEVAGNSEAAAKASWVRSQLQRPLLGGQDALLSIDADDWNAATAATFTAQLMRPFRGQRKFSTALVQVDVVDGSAKLEDPEAEWIREIDLVLSTPST
jgi:hypothetical protein